MRAAIAKFLKGKKTPMWLSVIVMPVVTIAIATALNFYAREEIVVRTIVYERIGVIERQSGDFQVHAAAFVNAILDGEEDVKKERNRLMENIVNQNALIEDVKNVARDIEDGTIETYQERLSAMKKATENTKDVLSMRPFWEAASDLLVARDKMLRQLHLGVGLKDS
ncbi:MAG: hypothetical protein OXC95_11195 [Dehalococcoidia bacterium]|nr:hypothetical protein [Dehalococcoidia bacterium]